MPTQVTAVRREHVEAHIEDLLSRRTVATALNRYAGLKQFFRFLLEDGEILGSTGGWPWRWRAKRGS
jgi:hypothetical protein